MTPQPAQAVFDGAPANAAPANATPFRYTLSEPEQRMRTLERSVALLIARTKLGEFCTKGFREVRGLLETVPLITPDFLAATRHLRNAYDYADLGEFGAAAFELNIVRGILLRL